MSYCRFGNGSDVYMFPHVGGYIDCCMCSLPAPKKFRVVWSVWNQDKDFKFLFRRRKPWDGPRKYKPYVHHQHIERSRSDREIYRRKTKDERNRQSVVDTYGKTGKKPYRVAVFEPRPQHFTKRSDAIKHLEKHRKAGDNVPQYAIDRLREEIETKGDTFRL